MPRRMPPIVPRLVQRDVPERRIGAHTPSRANVPVVIGTRRVRGIGADVRENAVRPRTGCTGAPATARSPAVGQVAHAPEVIHEPRSLSLVELGQDSLAQ